MGVYQRKVQDGDDNDNTLLAIPFSTMGDLYDTKYITGIFMDYEGENHQQLARVVRSVLAGHHNFRPDDRRAVFIADFKQDFDEFTVVTTALKILLAFIGALTLGIGGIGLMNIMLVSVQQRTREIGIEKALGAHKGHILFQFLAEALAITFAGGLGGIAIAYIISWVVGSLPLMSAFGDDLAGWGHSPAHQGEQPACGDDYSESGGHHQRYGTRDPRGAAGSDREPALRIGG